jgi:hypothetical protein
MPFYDPSSWELSKVIFENSKTLFTEYQEALRIKLVKEKPNDTTSFNNDLYVGHVDFFPIHMDPTVWSNKERTMYNKMTQMVFDRNKNYCPVAKSIIEKFPAIRQWYWNSLEPGGEVTPHYGTNGRLYNKIPDHHRIQYCWEPGNNCKFYLDNEYLEYTNNLCFGFEDGMDLHWVKNDGNEWRTVLIIDLWRDQCPAVDWTAGHTQAVPYVKESVN